MFDLFSDNDFQTDASSSYEGTEKALTLYELNSLVREVLETTLSDDYWVEAELSEVRESKGHCYMSLIQYGGTETRRGNKRTPIAQASAKCWQSTWMRLRPRFERVTGQTLHPGLKVLLRVHVNFHEYYGFSWIVNDIDPNYTMGDMARRRQEIIQQLKEEGVFDLQRELQLPMFCQRIAVISSATAAGYGDFCNQLADNEYGLKFEVKLFPAIMQGEQVEQSIIDALNSIFESSSIEGTNEDDTPPFDCVVIIRGGGATADLSGFDTLALAENVAQFPLPIITGIGHDRDESVLDMVANTRVKTPTAAAAFLIGHLAEVLTLINDCQDKVTTYLTRRMQMEQMRLQQLAEKIPVLFSLVKSNQTARLDRIFASLTSFVSQKLATENTHLVKLNAQLPPLVQHRLMREQHRLEMLSQQLQSLDPELLLRRGYSITFKDGHAVRNMESLQPGDLIETRLANGSVLSEVKKTNEKE